MPRMLRQLGRNLLFLSLCAAGIGALAGSLSPAIRPLGVGHRAPSATSDPELAESVARLDAALREHWDDAGVEPVAPADELTVFRRLSLALVGAIPSLEQIRRFEQTAPERRLDEWLESLLVDPRHHDYFAERYARAFVGTQDGPFLVYRRRRFVSWLTEQVAADRPYDQLIRELVADDGLWTDAPATNFLTVTIKPADDQDHPEPSELASRVSRAMLGIRMDCAECHDHPWETWKETDFQGLAAFFSQTRQVAFRGIRDVNEPPRIVHRQTGQTIDVTPRVPFAVELLPRAGQPRDRLATWITHPDNRRFHRAAANRVWALMFGKPLVEPVDDIREDAPLLGVLDVLADDFAAHRCSVRRLVRVIAASAAFRLDSRGLDDADAAVRAEQAWAMFPLVRLRAEQVAGGITQAATLATLDQETHIVLRLAAQGGQRQFLRRFGDSGEDELTDAPETISQRLLMMNGNLVKNQLNGMPLLNAPAQIALLAADDAAAVETAYLTVLTRRPTPAEAEHFVERLSRPAQRNRRQRVEDLYWALLNSTEFAWSH